MFKRFLVNYCFIISDKPYVTLDLNLTFYFLSVENHPVLYVESLTVTFEASSEILTPTSY